MNVPACEYSLIDEARVTAEFVRYAEFGEVCVAVTALPLCDRGESML